MSPTPKKTVSKKAEPKRPVAKKAAPKKAAPKKAAPKKAAAPKPAVKKAAPKKPAAGKAAAPKVASKKAAAPKPAAKKSAARADDILDKVRLLAARLLDKQARDIRALDVRGLSSVSDAILVATAKSLRQAKALADDILDCCGQHGFGYLGMEGYQGAEWILLDLNDVVVHVFQEETRRFFNLEGMWTEAAEIVIPGQDGTAA